MTSVLAVFLVASQSATTTAKASSSTATSTKPKATSSADEIKVLELKKIVTACGMRKRWASEFAGYADDVGHSIFFLVPSPQRPINLTICLSGGRGDSQYRRQAKHILGILAAYGIKGTPTIAKAKRRRTELDEAEELGKSTYIRR